MSSSSSPASDNETPLSSSSPSSQLHTFPTSLSLKLTDDNFLIWSQQVLAQVEGLNLLKFLESSSTPPLFLSSGKENPNPLFLLHKQQDNLLVVWLLASMSNPLLTKLVGLRSAYQIWDKLNVYFASNTHARVRKLKTQLKTPKRDRSINVYLLDIKRVIDSLAVVGSKVSTEDHLEAILDGPPRSMIRSSHLSRPVLIPTLLRTLKLCSWLKKRGLTNISLLIILSFKLILHPLNGTLRSLHDLRFVEPICVANTTF